MSEPQHELRNQLLLLEHRLFEVHWCICTMWQHACRTQSLQVTPDQSIRPSNSGSKKRRLRAQALRKRMWRELYAKPDGHEIVAAQEVCISSSTFGHEGCEESIEVSEGDLACESVASSIDIDMDSVGNRVDEHVATIMKQLRGTFSGWPPVEGLSEEEGCATIQKICEDEVLKTIDESVKELAGLSLTDIQSGELRNRIIERVTTGLDQWKGFAGLVAKDTSVGQIGHVDTAKPKSELKPISQREMPQSRKKHKKQHK